MARAKEVAKVLAFTQMARYQLQIEPLITQNGVAPSFLTP
jgi:hypothetical protein